MNRTLRRILLILSTTVFVYSSVRLIVYLSEAARIRSQNAQIAAMADANDTPEAASESGTVAGADQAAGKVVKNTATLLSPRASAVTPFPTESTDPRPAVTPFSLAGIQSSTSKVLPCYRQLHLSNPDMIGYLKIPLIPKIKLAVVQRDNTYYLSHDFSGSPNSNGTLFLDENCSIEPRSDNLLVYGHNMRTGEMFGELHRLRSASFLAGNPFVNFDTLYEEAVYIPLCVGIVSLNPSDADFFNFTRTDFYNESDFDDFTEQARKVSTVRLNTDMKYGDELLTLVTCCDGSDDRRFIVLLRRMRDDETRESALRTIFAPQ